jgi:hypothetical protein
MNFVDDAVMHALPPPWHTRSHKTRQRFDFAALGGSQHDNPAIGEISAIVKCSRIPEIARGPQFGGEA